MSKTRVEYIKETAFLGDLYKAQVYEEQRNTPGFAPETFEVLVCDIWLEYSDWNRRVMFKDTKMEQESTLKAISDIFTGKLDKSKFEPTPERSDT